VKAFAIVPQSAGQGFETTALKPAAGVEVFSVETC
jgi:hypothetical protein